MELDWSLVWTCLPPGWEYDDAKHGSDDGDNDDDGDDDDGGGDGCGYMLVYKGEDDGGNVENIEGIWCT